MNTYLICGLGNPGSEYEKTRHNSGFIIIDQILKNTDQNIAFSNKSDFKCHFAEININQKKIIFAKPKTFMNNSGQTVKAISDFYKIPSDNILVIHDDLDILLGSYKISNGSQSAGHHGIDSIIHHLNGNTFWRARVGIITKSYIEARSAITDKNQRHKFTSDYLLNDFSNSEINLLVEEITPAITQWIKQHFLV